MLRESTLKEVGTSRRSPAEAELSVRVFRVEAELRTTVKIGRVATTFCGSDHDIA